jgi:hypothetical protein
VWYLIVFCGSYLYLLLHSFQKIIQEEFSFAKLVLLIFVMFGIFAAALYRFTRHAAFLSGCTVLAMSIMTIFAMKFIPVFLMGKQTILLGVILETMPTIETQTIITMVLLVLSSGTVFVTSYYALQVVEMIQEKTVGRPFLEFLWFFLESMQSYIVRYMIIVMTLLFAFVVPTFWNGYLEVNQVIGQFFNLPVILQITSLFVYLMLAVLTSIMVTGIVGGLGLNFDPRAGQQKRLL